MRRVGLIAVLTIILASVASASFVLRGQKGTETAEDFIQLRSKVFGMIQKQIDSGFPGAKYVFPKTNLVQTSEEIERDRKIFSDGRWQTVRTLQWKLDLTEDALPTELQENSETQCSTQMLNHYFKDLKQLGFRNNGSPSVLMAGVQSTSNEWFQEGRRQQLSISACAFVEPISRQAVVQLMIREAWPK